MQIAAFVPRVPIKLRDQRQLGIRQSLIRIFRGDLKSCQAEMNPIKTAVGREGVSHIKETVARILRMKGESQKSAFLLKKNSIGDVQKNRSSRFHQVRDDRDSSWLLDNEQPVRLS